MKQNKLYCGDCLEVMVNIPDNHIDMVFCDLPYGTTRNSWDEIISFEKLWEQYNRIVKDNGVFVLTSQQPFTSKLISDFFFQAFQLMNIQWNVIIIMTLAILNGLITSFALETIILIRLMKITF